MEVESKRFRVVVLSDTSRETTQLKSGAHFFVRYDTSDPADAERLALSAHLGLRQDDQTLYELVTRLTNEPRVQAPSEPVENIGLTGPGPYEFRLPKLEPGSYQLCGQVSFQTGNEPTTSDTESFCKTIEVVA
jgi:hypothetical protein